MGHTVGELKTTSDSNTVDATLTRDTAFSIMFVTIGMCCFMWQSITTGWMFYKGRKPIVGLVFAQATLGVAVTIVTMLTSLIHVDCVFRLMFSVVGINLADIALQFVLLWKAYLGNNRSKIILGIGSIPIICITAFIIVNMTFGKSETVKDVGYCFTKYPLFIVVTKAIIDCTANTFLSACFVLVIYRHYRVLGNSIQKVLIAEGLIYCFGVCFSNILTGILLSKEVLGGNTPILYTIDWYLASYLIIKQLRPRGKSSLTNNKEDEEENDSIDYSIDRASSIPPATHPYSDRKLVNNDDGNSPRHHDRGHDTYYSSMEGTLVHSPSSPKTPSFFADELKYPLPSLPPFEKKIFVKPQEHSQKQQQQLGDLSNITSYSDDRADTSDLLIKDNSTKQ